jgi:hypothetical protein
VEKALLNHEAIDKNRAEWAQTAAALLALHPDHDDVLLSHNSEEAKRAVAGVATRALAEMAICTSPNSGGLTCTQIDFDELLADVNAMVECATQSDAYYYGLTKTPLEIAKNGSFIFDTSFLEDLHLPYMHAQGSRAFRDAASAYGDAFEPPNTADLGEEPPDIDPELNAAVVAEFGLDLEQLFDLSQSLAKRALPDRRPFLELRRSELTAILRGLGPATDADRAYSSLTLVPRPLWNKAPPGRATNRDWQPWRMDRRLSLTRRPWLQLTEDADPTVLVFPILTNRVVHRIFDLAEGRLSAELFDTKEIERWLGKIVDNRGNAFNGAVAERLRSCGYEALPDQLMTLFGGKKDLGDVDVLAWNQASNTVWIIECKRLLMARTVQEVGERLTDYTTLGKRNGKRTPIQKHLDRVAFLKENPTGLAKATRIIKENLIIRSALITDKIVPMQFSKTMDSLVDRVCNAREIPELFRVDG